MQEHVKHKDPALAKDLPEEECKGHVQMCLCKQCQTKTADTSLTLTFEHELGIEDVDSPCWNQRLL